MKLIIYVHPPQLSSKPQGSFCMCADITWVTINNGEKHKLWTTITYCHVSPKPMAVPKPNLLCRKGIIWTTFKNCWSKIQTSVFEIAHVEMCKRWPLTPSLWDILEPHIMWKSIFWATRWYQFELKRIFLLKVMVDKVMMVWPKIG